MKELVCQLFEVCQHEFANLSLPCEGRLKLASKFLLRSELYSVRCCALKRTGKYASESKVVFV